MSEELESKIDGFEEEEEENDDNLLENNHLNFEEDEEDDENYLKNNHLDFEEEEDDISIGDLSNNSSDFKGNFLRNNQFAIEEEEEDKLSIFSKYQQFEEESSNSVKSNEEEEKSINFFRQQQIKKKFNSIKSNEYNLSNLSNKQQCEEESNYSITPNEEEELNKILKQNILSNEGNHSSSNSATEEKDFHPINTSQFQKHFSEEEELNKIFKQNTSNKGNHSSSNSVTEEEDFHRIKTNQFQKHFSEEEDEHNKIVFKQNVMSNEGNHSSSNSVTEEEDFHRIKTNQFQNHFSEEDNIENKQFIEQEEEDEAKDANIAITNNFHQITEEEEAGEYEEEDDFEFESTEPAIKQNYLEDDHVELITDTDRDTKMLFKKLENMDLDLSKIENPSSSDEFEKEEEEEGDQGETSNYEEDEKESDVLSLSNYNPMDKDTKELLDVINSLNIEKQPDEDKPLQVFDPAIVNGEISTNEQATDNQFSFQDSFVYRDIQADMKPFKQRGNKRNIYEDLQSFDFAALVVDPSKPENDILKDYVTPDYNLYDKASVITARSNDKPLPEYELLSIYPGELESLDLQAFLDINDL